MSMASSSPPPPVLRHVAMLPFMAKGHAMPLLHLARLLLRRGLASAVTFLATPREAPFIRAGAPAAAAVVELPFPASSAAGPQSMEDISSASVSAFLDVVSASATLRPVFADALAALDPRPDLLVHDGFLSWAKDAADDLGVPRLVSLGIGAFASCVPLAVAAHKPHARVTSPLEPFEVPGMPPGFRLTKADLAPPFDDPEPSGPHWDFILESGVAYSSSHGTVLNSFHELEAFYIDKWNREMPRSKMWPVGPLCLAGEPAVRTLDSGVAEWLDSRLATNRPVLYVAFGSQADLSRSQLEEIATGLDQSDLDFVWVVRSKWFGSEDEPFQGRFGDRGRVVTCFIDQLGVLSHQAVKGFFSHCGWNSVTESIAMGVPILAYPMAAEQKLNAKFVADVLGVGIRIWPSKPGDSGHGTQLVSSQDVQALARELILGEEGRRAAAKVSELATSARAAMETGGSSFESLELMVREVCEIGRPEAKE